VVEDTFLATILGAAVAGVVGLVTLLIQQYLQDRQKLDLEVLVPAFNYVDSVPPELGWDLVVDPPWRQLDSYNWRRIPRRYRVQLRELSRRVEEYGKVYHPYAYYLLTNGNAAFGESVKASLVTYLTQDGSSVVGDKIGVENGAVIQISWIVNGVLPRVLTNPKDSVKAWDQVITAGPGSAGWAGIVTRNLRERDPAALARLFEEIQRNPQAKNARALAAALSEPYTRVVEQAVLVRKSLARRLGISGALKD
jgi:hypothetical protein